MSLDFDVVIVGAGAAGLFCAGEAARRGLRVLLLDHSERVAEKIRISGGGRCNFTNRQVAAVNFVSDNPNFCRSALSRFTPAEFIARVEARGIPFHEKHKGQLFCDRSADDIIQMLLDACAQGGVTRWQPCDVRAVQALADGTGTGPRYQLETGRGTVRSRHLVVATGGLSIPKIGASGWGHQLAQQFGLPLVPTRPALVPLTFAADDWAPFAQLAGLSLPVHIETGDKKSKAGFHEDLLFTHRGLSGPAVLQISSFWAPGQAIRINLLPELDVLAWLRDLKSRSRRLLANELATLLPSRLADAWVQGNPLWQRPMDQIPDKALLELAERLRAWTLVPNGSEGYAKAEATRGGVDTRALSSQTMESRQHPGLYFIGEVVDVTGWLGGYNFQWAWSSAYTCAEALATQKNCL